jgi:hypothetical protein
MYLSVCAPSAVRGSRRHLRRHPPQAEPNKASHMEHDVPLPVAAACLGMSWHVVYRLALSGRLGRLTRRNNRWHVTAAGIEAYKEQQHQQADRQQASGVEK